MSLTVRPRWLTGEYRTWAGAHLSTTSGHSCLDRTIASCCKVQTVWREGWCHGILYCPPELFASSTMQCFMSIHSFHFITLFKIKKKHVLEIIAQLPDYKNDGKHIVSALSNTCLRTHCCLPVQRLFLFI